MFLKCKIDFFLFLPKGMITLMWKKFWRREMRRDESWKKANFDGGIWSVIFPKSGKEIPQRRMVDHTKTEIPWRVIVHYHRIIQKVNQLRYLFSVAKHIKTISSPLNKTFLTLQSHYFLLESEDSEFNQFLKSVLLLFTYAAIPIRALQ